MLRLRPLVAFLCLALALCLLGLWHARSQTGALRRVTNTTEEGINLNPSLSGDGRRIAFESTEDLAHAGGSDRFRAIRADVTTDPAVFAQLAATRAPAPGISQDGSRIAFASKDNPLGTNPDGNSEIFFFDGSTLRQITNTTPVDASTRTRDGNFQPSLTDDGRFIAFSSNRNPASLNGDGNLEIFVFDTTANTFSQLTNTSGSVGAADAKISGDGTRVAYIRDNGATQSTQRDLVLQDRTGGTTRVLATNVTNPAFTYGRAISDDGTRIVYAADIATNSSQVFIFDGRLTNATRQVTALGVRDTDVPLHPTISGDGTRVAFATRRPISGFSNTDNSIELYTYDVPTGQFARVTNAPSTADGFSGSTRLAEVVSSLNDDGSVVAFNFPRTLSGVVTSGMENNSEIYMTGTAPRPTTGALTILNEASFGHEPSTTKAVSPDSRAVALGGALAFREQQAAREPDGSFPTTLDGTTVTVNGRRAQIFFISPTQVNFYVPPETELGTADVVVTNSEGFQSRGTVTVLRAAPGIFTKSGDGQGEAVVLNANMQGSGVFDPSDGQLRLIIFTTGVLHATQVTATAGGRALTVESVMRTPGMPGMDEVRVLVPSDLRGAGTVNLVVRADNRDSNPATIIFSGDGCRDIVINEVLADPPDGLAGDANHDGVRDSSDDEFVELVNTTANNIDISGYQLLTRSTSSTSDTLRHTFASGTIFPASSAIVIFGGGSFNPNNPVFGGAQVLKTSSSGGLSLTNSGGVVTLREPSQSIVNIFSYGGSTGLNGDANQSLTRAPDAGTNSGCGNFALHSTAPGSNGQPFSPGTRVNGSPFAQGTGQLSSVTISPPSATIAVGQTTQFTAQARDQFNRPLTNVTITFASDNTNVATVDGVTTDATTGIATATVTGRNQGTAHITAQATNGTTTVTSSQATLTVNPLPPMVTRVDVSPANATINRGQTQQFTASAFDQNNQPVAGATFTWTSSDPNVATINSSGLATGVGVGSATITAMTTDATGATTSGTAALNVQVPLVINEINGDVPSDNVSTPAIEGDSNRDGVRDSDDDEFIELFNNSSAPVDISGVIIADGTSNRFTIPANTTLASGRALVIFGGGTPPANDPAFGGALVLAVSGSGTLSLNDTGDTVNVKLNFGAADHLITSVTYGGTGNPPAPSDQSLTRSPDVETGTSGGTFVAHNTATNAAGRTFSPGTRADGTPFGSPAITRIEVSPLSAAIDVGATQVFTARAFSNIGGPEIEVLNVSFIWDSSDTSKATVAPTTGASTTAKGVASGNNISIRARAGAQLGSATLTVNSAPPVLTSVTISPTSATINAGQTQQFTGQALDQFGQPIGGVTVTFASNNTTVATVDSVSPTSATGSATATVTGQANGSAEIRASATNGTTTVTSAPATLTVAPVANPGNMVISQVYGGGGNSGATFTNDFIEIFNRGTTAVDVTGWSVQYNSATGTGAFQVTPICPTGPCLIQPGKYFLVQEASNAAVGSPLPTPDATGTIILAATAGRVALVTNTTAIPASATCAQELGAAVDFVGYGTTATCFEGSGPAPAPSATTADLRLLNGCTDTNNNASDFATAAPNPRNSSSPVNDCTAAATPNISINDVTVTEGNTGTTTATFTVSLSSPAPSGGVTFNIATADGTATVADNDYVAKSLTAQTIPAGQQTYMFTVTVNGDTNVEPNETFFVNLTSVVGANVTDAQGQGTITNDDSSPLPTLSINDVTQNEGNTGTTTFTFTVSLSAAAPTGGVTFDIATADGTAQDDNPAATEDNDYVAKSLTAQTIPAGQQTFTFDVTVNGDTVVEANETFFVSVTNVTGATVSDGQGTGTITNDDSAPPPTGNIVISQVYGGGGNSGATFTNDFIEIFNRGTTAVDLTGWSVQYLGATGTGTWSVTNLSGTLQPGRYYLVQEASNAAVGSPLPTPDATGTIVMAATAGKVALVNTTTALSGACPSSPGIIDLIGYGTTASCFEGSGPAPAPSATTADFRKAGGCTDTNDNVADFLVATPFPRNTSSPVNNCSAGATPNLTINDVTAAEGNSGTTIFTFTVSLSAPAPSTDVTFDIATQNNTATTANSDYVSKSLTNQVIPAGQQTYTFSVTVNGDTTVEPDETFFVNVTNVSGANLSDGQGVGTIQNDDSPPPALSINDVTMNEGNTGTTTFTFTVSLSSPAPAGGVSFNIATQDDTATVADNDYVARSITGQTITAGQQTFNFDVTVNGDTAVEPNESFFVNVSGVTNATLADGQGVGTITNDDAVATTADLSVTKTDSPDPVAIGNDITYTITVTNGGPDAASSAVFTDTVPTNTTFRSITSPAGWTCSTVPAVGATGSINCTNPSFTVGSSVFTLVVRVDTTATDGTTISNTASVSSSAFDNNTGNNSATQTTTAKTPLLVISQVYGGGSNSGAAYGSDFVQIFNRGTTTVDFAATNYSVQYASAAGSFTAGNTVSLTSGTIAPGQYFLIKLAPASPTVGTNFTADVTNTGINMSATDGKVALVLGTTVATTTTGCPTAVTVVDLVGYGSANCAETTATAALSATKVAVRNNGGCTDTGNNSSDFTVTTVNTSSPVPKNSSAAPSPCP